MYIMILINIKIKWKFENYLKTRYYATTLLQSFKTEKKEDKNNNWLLQLLQNSTFNIL
jgi:hypothetical protein